WVAGLAALAVTLGGLAALAGGRRWAGLSSRYDVPSPAAAAVPGSHDDAGSPGAGSPGGAREPESGASPAPRRPEREVSAWERISRGEDPTQE
ncbi:MAG: Trp biosynthesis-associated membrane protein, partial [Oryzihumus sp.]